MIYLLRDGVQRHSTICHGLLIVSSTLKIAPRAQSCTCPTVWRKDWQPQAVGSPHRRCGKWWPTTNIFLEARRKHRWEWGW
jgi:hypothetical protein